MTHCHRLKIFCLLALSTGLNGCCAISEYFCGPDQSRWVSVSYRTHEEALATLMEAMRRDDPDVIYQSLSQEFVQAYGLDSLSFEKAWEVIRERVPGVHLLGNATVEGPERLGSDRARYVLSRAGYEVEVVLVRKSFWEIEWTSDGDAMAEGDYVRGLRRHVRVRRSEPGVPYRVTIEFDPEDLYDFDPSRLERAGVGREWKVLTLQVLE